MVYSSSILNIHLSQLHSALGSSPLSHLLFLNYIFTNVLGRWWSLCMDFPQKNWHYRYPKLRKNRCFSSLLIYSWVQILREGEEEGEKCIEEETEMLLPWQYKANVRNWLINNYLFIYLVWVDIATPTWFQTLQRYSISLKENWQSIFLACKVEIYAWNVTHCSFSYSTPYCALVDRKVSIIFYPNSSSYFSSTTILRPPFSFPPSSPLSFFSVFTYIIRYKDLLVDCPALPPHIRSTVGTMEGLASEDCIDSDEDKGKYDKKKKSCKGNQG